MGNKMRDFLDLGNKIEFEGRKWTVVPLAGPAALASLEMLLPRDHDWDYEADPYGPGTFAHFMQMSEQERENARYQYVLFDVTDEHSDLKYEQIRRLTPTEYVSMYLPGEELPDGTKAGVGELIVKAKLLGHEQAFAAVQAKMKEYMDNRHEDAIQNIRNLAKTLREKINVAPKCD